MISGKVKFIFGEHEFIQDQPEDTEGKIPF
jgi:hypothetical protein